MVACDALAGDADSCYRRHVVKSYAQLSHQRFSCLKLQVLVKYGEVGGTDLICVFTEMRKSFSSLLQAEIFQEFKRIHS